MSEVENDIARIVSEVEKDIARIKQMQRKAIAAARCFKRLISSPANDNGETRNA